MSTEHYQKTKTGFEIRCVKDIKMFLKKKKKCSENMIASDKIIFLNKKGIMQKQNY